MAMLILDILWRHATVFVLLSGVGVLELENHVLVHRLAECSRQKEALAQAQARLAAQVERQNDAIDAWREESRKKQAEATAAMIRAQHDAKRYQQDAQRIEAYRAGGDACASMHALLHDYFRR